MMSQTRESIFQKANNVKAFILSRFNYQKAKQDDNLSKQTLVSGNKEIAFYSTLRQRLLFFSIDHF